MASTEKIVVVGFGWVGQANALALKMQGFDVSFFDPMTPPRHYAKHNAVYDSILKLHDIKSKDSENTWYMVCVGDRVSDDGVQDISNIKRALDSLWGAQGGVMLRSTILPDLLENLPFDYYVPEFLHEKKAVEECLDPYLFVTGSRPGVRAEPNVFDLWRAKSRKSFEGTPREASLIKYLSNLWNAMRIAFVNEFGDAIGRPADKKQLEKIHGIVNFLFDNRSYLRYGRAYSGHCLPKDSRAFANWYSKNAPLPLLFGMYASNLQHQKLEEQYPLMPEWYSEWPDRHISGKRALQELWYSLTKYLRDPSLIWRRVTDR